MDFKHGDRVKCTIDGTDIDDAMVSIDKEGTPFICQDKKDGSCAEDKLGYKFSWRLDNDFTSELVTYLRLAEKSFDSPKIGDEYKDRNGESQFVLGVAGRVIFLSNQLSKDNLFSALTKEQLIILGYTIVQDEPNEEPTEITLEEIEKLVGKKVKIVKKK